MIRIINRFSLFLIIISLFCSITSCNQREKRREKIAREIQNLNLQNYTSSDYFDSDIMQLGQLSKCEIVNDAVIFEFEFNDSNYLTKYYTRDYFIFAIATNLKNAINKEKFIPKEIINDLKIAEYNLVYKYIDTNNNSYIFLVSPQELLEMKNSPISVLETVNRDSVKYTITQLEEASMKSFMNEDSKISDISVEINNEYEVFTLTFNHSNSNMKYVSLDAMKLGVINVYQTDNVYVKQARNILKELNLNGIKLVIKNNFGFIKEEAITWNEISSSNPTYEHHIINAQLQTHLNALNTDLKKEIGQNGIVNAWVDENNGYIIFNYVFNGTSHSVENLPSSTILKNDEITAAKKNYIQDDLEFYKGINIIGIKRIFQDKNGSSKRTITLNFNEL